MPTNATGLRGETVYASIGTSRIVDLTIDFHDVSGKIPMVDSTIAIGEV